MNPTLKNLYWLDPPLSKNRRRHVSDGSVSLCRQHRYRDTTAPLTEADRAAGECPAGVCATCWRVAHGLPDRPDPVRRRAGT